LFTNIINYTNFGYWCCTATKIFQPSGVTQNSKARDISVIPASKVIWRLQQC